MTGPDDQLDYVTSAPWVSRRGRPELIDDVADQFERPGPDAGSLPTASGPERPARPLRRSA